MFGKLWQKFKKVINKNNQVAPIADQMNAGANDKDNTALLEQESFDSSQDIKEPASTKTTKSRWNSAFNVTNIVNALTGGLVSSSLHESPKSLANSTMIIPNAKSSTKMMNINGVTGTDDLQKVSDVIGEINDKKQNKIKGVNIGFELNDDGQITVKASAKKGVLTETQTNKALDYVEQRLNKKLSNPEQVNEQQPKNSMSFSFGALGASLNPFSARATKIHPVQNSMMPKEKMQDDKHSKGDLILKKPSDNWAQKVSPPMNTPQKPIGNTTDIFRC